MKLLLRLILVILLIPLAIAADEKPTNLDDLVTMVESKLDGLQGGAVAIMYKGQVVYKKTFGYRKGNTGEINSSTLFTLASVSKPVTAVAIALLKPDFNKRTHIPSLKPAVSLKDLLSHTTGYNYSGNPDIEKGVGRAKLLQLLKKQKPACKPGECFTYSNACFSVVDEALVKQGKTLKQAFTGLRTALGVTGMQFVTVDKKAAFASPHMKDEKGLKPLPFPPYYPNATPASAGVFASLDGMIEFYKLSFGYRPDLISAEKLKEMQAPIIANEDFKKWGLAWAENPDVLESYYAMGWRIMRDIERPGRDIVFHGGSIRGVSTFIGHIPSAETGIIILLNQNSSKGAEAAMTLWRMATEQN